MENLCSTPMAILYSNKLTRWKLVRYLTINTKEKKLYEGDRELTDISAALTPQKKEFIKAGGSYAIVFGKKLQSFAAGALGH
jgi:aconitase B